MTTTYSPCPHGQSADYPFPCDACDAFDAAVAHDCNRDGCDFKVTTTVTTDDRHNGLGEAVITYDGLDNCRYCGRPFFFADETEA